MNGEAYCRDAFKCVLYPVGISKLTIFVCKLNKYFNIPAIVMEMAEDGAVWAGLGTLSGAIEHSSQPLREVVKNSKVSRNNRGQPKALERKQHDRKKSSQYHTVWWLNTVEFDVADPNFHIFVRSRSVRISFERKGKQLRTYPTKQLTSYFPMAGRINQNSSEERSVRHSSSKHATWTQVDWNYRDIAFDSNWN